MDRIVHPGNPAEVTAEWLSGVLRSSGLFKDGHVTGVDVDVIGEDRGFTGVIARLTPRYSPAAPGAPASLVAKFPLAEREGSTSYRDYLASNPHLARQYAERGAREIRFYEMIGRRFNQIPEFFASHVDVDAGEVVLLIEDLGGGEPGDALAGCTVAQARSVLLGIVDLHARWWENRGLAGFEWLGDWSAGIPGRAERFQSQATLVVERYQSYLTPEIADCIMNLRAGFPSILEHLVAAPRTLVHGDLHLDNIMFMPTSDGFRAYIIDWQGVARGPALLDVAGFLAESLRVEDRREFEFELLHEYHTLLEAAGVRQYTFERLCDDYLRALCVRFTGVVGWLARVEIEELEGRERALVEAMLKPGSVIMAALDHRITERFTGT